MNAKRKIISHFLGVILTLVFLFPSLLQFEHLFENHEHLVCKENKVHLHQKNLDCSIYDFHFSTFSFLPIYPISLFVDAPLNETSFSVSQEVYLNPYFHCAQRGPPTMIDFTV